MASIHLKQVRQDQLVRFEQAKEDFKQRLCADMDELKKRKCDEVDQLFACFLAEITNSNYQVPVAAPMAWPSSYSAVVGGGNQSSAPISSSVYQQQQQQQPQLDGYQNLDLFHSQSRRSDLNPSSWHQNGGDHHHASANQGGGGESATQPWKAKWSLVDQCPTSHRFKVIDLDCWVANCKARFDDQNQLEWHMSTVHKFLPFPCPHSNCGTAMFKTRAELIEHFHQSHLNENRWFCFKCQQNLAGPCELFAHLTDCHSKGTFGCTFDNCAHVCYTRYEAGRHYDETHPRIHGYKRTREEDQSYRPRDRDDSKNVRQRESNERFKVITNQCHKEGCQSKFRTEESLNEHMFELHQMLPHPCPVDNCEASFFTIQSIREHGLGDAHKALEAFECRHCGYWNGEFERYRYHMHMHHAVGEFACTSPGCDSVATTRVDALKHYSAKH